MNRYACEAIDRIWYSSHQLELWHRFWFAELAALGIKITPPSEPNIRSMTQRGWELEIEYGHDVAAACEALRDWFVRSDQPEAARWLHYGLCSSDVVDYAWQVRMTEVDAELYDLATVVTTPIGELGTRGPAHTVYRTHGQAARIGLNEGRWNGHARRISLAENRRPHARVQLSLLGPVGTSGMDRVNPREVAGALRVSVAAHPSGAQAADRLEWSAWLTGVASLATACERFATDVRLLSQTGIDEVREGRGASYRGSSSMPHKHNPTRSERICGLAAVVRGAASGYAEAASSIWGSHSLEHSSAERVTFPLVSGLVGFILSETASIAGSLEVNTAAVLANVAGAPEDSYARRNSLIEEGLDGGSAYEAAREPHDPTT